MTDKAPNGITDPRLLEVVKAVSALSTEHGRGPTSKRLNKLAYLSELISIRDRGVRLTSTPFVHYHYGPYCEEVGRAAEAVPDVIERETFPNQHGKVSTAWRVKGPTVEVNLSEEDADVIQRAITLAPRDTQELTADLDACIPFLWTKKGDPIDFVRYERLWKEIRENEASLESGGATILKGPDDIASFVGSLRSGTA